jgi:hypothetical protein
MINDPFRSSASVPQKSCGTTAFVVPQPPIGGAERNGTGGKVSKPAPRALIKKRQEAAARAAKPTPCPRCSAPTLYGLDDDTAATEARVDPTPIDKLGEVAAILAGLKTYTAWPVGAGRVELSRRDRFRLLSRPKDYPTLAEHRCGTQWPAAQDTSPKIDTEGCPF